MIGKTISHYQVTAKLGAGGMGEVYRARDTKLGRDVALKLLPEVFARDADRMARFKREAQVLASLNHPNIAAIYGLEEAGETRALALELVEGPTLAERLQSGLIPLAEALNIAQQMAEALEAAHDQGIIHRDLKPANVKVKDDGTVKVLDFGLAKALADPSSEEDIATSPTLSAAATKAGIILGTAAYMAPEQAKGKKVDRRADIWAFGVVLFEMLTGKRLFTGENISETLAAVIMKDPAWDLLPADTPAAIRKLLHRCLEKDPKQRLQAIGEARIALADYEADSTAAALPVAVPAAAPQPTWRRVVPWAVAAVLVVALSVSVWSRWRAAPPTSSPTMRLGVQLPADTPVWADYGAAAVLSPDGTRLAYIAGGVSSRRLYIRPLDQLEPTMVSGSEDAYHPFFSPDGEWVAFFTREALKKVSVFGGTPLTLCEVNLNRGGTWEPDGTIIFAPTPNSGLSRVSAAGGPPEPITTLSAEKGEFTHRWPQFLPGGQAVLFTSHTSGSGFDDATIEVLELESKQRKVLHQGGSYARYVPTGHVVYVREGTLYALPFDLNNLEVTGTPNPLLEGVTSNPAHGSAQFDFSQTGALVYSAGSAVQQKFNLIWADRRGKTTALSDQADLYSMPALSPDGSRLSLTRGAFDAADVWVFDLERGTRTRLTFTDKGDARPIWTPDGQTITFTSNRQGGAPNLYWKPADGSGEAEQLTESENIQVPNSWSPDGKVLALAELNGANGWDIVLLHLEQEKKTDVFLATKFQEFGAAFSPDGRWLAYSSNESGPYEIYVRPYPGPGGKWQVSTAGGWLPRWSRDGRTLFYRSGEKVVAVPVSAEGSVFRAGTPQELFSGQFSDFILGNYDVSADGRRFLMLQPAGEQEEGADRTHVTLILNWFDAFRRLAPTGKN